MDKLYAPWRNSYVTGAAKGKKKLKKDCVFCQEFIEDDDKKNFVVKRYERCAVVLNHYPYNAGHLLVLPYDHEGELFLLNEEVRKELIEIVNVSIEVLKKTLKPDGFNVGLNLGSAGGGGIPSHLHFHVLPRWNGDTNYLATLAETKTICSDLCELYDKLKEEFDKY